MSRRKQSVVEGLELSRQVQAYAAAEVLRERGACAKIARDLAASQTGMPGAILTCGAALMIAAAIEARSGK